MKLNRILLMPDPAPAGGGVFDPTPPEGGTGATPPATQVPPVTATPPVVAPVTPPAAQLSKDELSEILKQAVTRGAASAQPQPQATFTQDDFDRTFNVFKPTKELLTALRTGDEDGALAEMQRMVMGVVKQAVTMSAFQMQELKEELLGQMKPALSFTQQEGERKLKEEFFDVHKDLKQYEPLVLKVTSDLKQNNVQIRDKAHAFELVAAETRKILTSILPQVGDGQPPIGGNPATNTSRMSTLSSGGQGGAGGSGTAPAKSKSPGMAVFD